jgi:hypothetical protein
MNTQIGIADTPDSLRIMRGEEHVGQAARFASGKWGAAGLNGKPKTMELFDSAEAVRDWFDLQAA